MALYIYRFPKIGKDAYSFIPNKENLIAMGGFSIVFTAIRKHDQKKFAIKRSRD